MPLVQDGSSGCRSRVPLVYQMLPTASIDALTALAHARKKVVVEGCRVIEET